MLSDSTFPLLFEMLSVVPEGGRGRGHLNVTWQGAAHFLRVSTIRLGKKIAFWYPVSEFLDYKTIEKTTVFCSLTNSHNSFRNFWSIFIPRSGIYAENDTLKNGTSRIGLYGSAPPPPRSVVQCVWQLLNICSVRTCAVADSLKLKPCSAKRSIRLTTQQLNIIKQHFAEQMFSVVQSKCSVRLTRA